MLNLLYHVFFVRSNYKGCVIERERVCVKTQAIEDRRVFADSSTKNPAKWCMCPTHDWNAKSQDRWRQLYFASSLRVKPSCETLAKHSVLPDCAIWYPLSIPTLYIPTLPTKVEECFRKKTLATNLESWRLLYPQSSTQLLVDFPQLLPLHFHIIERLIVQTLTTPFQSVKWGFGAAGKYWKKPRMADATWSLLRDLKN